MTQEAIPARARKKTKGKATEEKPRKKPEAEGGKFTGDRPVLTALSLVKPNGWNPNGMSPFERESLRIGLQTDGWLMSQSLLIWRTDDKGKERNLIIDGEQRWTVAQEAGFKRGPMVFLDGLPETEAKALTVKIDAKRGKFRDEPLGVLLREIQYELKGEDSLSLNLGIPEESLMVLLSEPEIVLPGAGADGGVGEEPSGAGTGLPTSTVRMVQVFLNPETHAEFSELVRSLASKYGTKNVSDTVLEAIRRAAKIS